jgi:hypothetical protein
MDFHEISYELYAIGDYSKRILCNLLHLVLPTWRLLEVVRWNDDDVMIHDPLRMRIFI